MKIPQRYKHTEFGLIPDDWVLCTFKDVLTTFLSSTYKCNFLGADNKQ